VACIQRRACYRCSASRACSISVDDAKQPFLEEGGHDAIIQLFGVISSLVLVGEPSNEEDYGSRRRQKPLPERYPTMCYTQRVRLAHFSVKEYLVSHRLQQSHDTRLSRYALLDTEVHRSLSRSSCEYLLYLASEPQIQTWIDEERDSEIATNRSWKLYLQDCLKDFLPAYPLLRYVCLHWRKHQGLAETGIGPLPTNGQLHISMLDDQRARISWLRLTIPENLLPGSRPLSKYSLETNKLHDGAKALYWASALGLRQTVSLLCEPTSHQDVCHVGGYYCTALQAAARYGHQEIVEILIASGADVNCYGGAVDTALSAAVTRGHSNIVLKLLQAGAGIGTRTKAGVHSATSLVSAAYGGYGVVVRILLQHIVQHNLQASVDVGEAILVAARDGHDDIIRVLLKHVVDERLEVSVDLGKAILEAACFNRIGVVRILMAYGVDLNVRYPGKARLYVGLNLVRLDPDPANPTCTSSLLNAAVAYRYGNQDMIKELIEAGATSDHLPEHATSTTPPDMDIKDDPERTTSTQQQETS
jgi:ankyrin repeat protein